MRSFHISHISRCGPFLESLVVGRFREQAEGGEGAMKIFAEKANPKKILRKNTRNLEI